MLFILHIYRYDVSSCKKKKTDIKTVLGLHCQILVAGSGATGAASVRSCQKILLCPIAPIPDSSKKDLLLVKAGPILNGGNSYEMTD